MRSLPVYCGLSLLLLIGCSSRGTSDLGNSGTNISKSEGNTAYAKRAKPRGDFSTPKSAVETFITAGLNKDADLLSQCFHPDSPGEFRKLREKTSSAKDLDELATFVRGAEIVDVKEKGDSAVVSVVFKSRNEEIRMKKSEGDWKILDF
jgi:hypothetical protein